MNPDEPPTLLEEECAALLAVCDDLLAQGNEPELPDDGRLSPELKSRLQRGLDCLRRLEHVWPRRSTLSMRDEERRNPKSEIRNPKEIPNRKAEIQTPTVSITGNSDLEFPSDFGFEISDFPGYEILEELGRGGMGVVYKARQIGLNRLVALKMISAGSGASPQTRSRFHTEAVAAGRLQHPHIVQIHDIGEHCGQLYFSLDLVEGGTLAQKLARQPQPAGDAAHLVETLARAVHHAHQHGIIHRDLKPANILLSADGTPKISDFGLAKSLEDDSNQTRTGTIVGTPSYMAPEQASGSLSAVGPAADIYALGVILYEMLTGRPPFCARTPLDTLELVRTQEPVPPRRLQPATPRDLETICLQCLAKEPRKRYASALDLADDLARFRAGRPIQARPVHVLERGWRWCRRNPVEAALLSCVALLLVVIAAGTSLAAWRLERERDRAVAHQRAAEQAQDVAQAERQQAVTNLYHARVEEAAALRRARGMGYRAKVFNRLQQALQLDTPEKDRDRLRDEAVACLGDFVGLEPIKLDDFPPDTKKAGIKTIALTKDGDQIAVALENGMIEVRNVSTRDKVAEFRESAVGLGIDPDHRWLVTAGARGTIKVWQDYGTGGAPAVHTIDMGADFAGLSGNGRFAVGKEKDGRSLSLWDVARQEVKAQLQVPSGEFEGPFQVSDNGQWVAQAARDGTKLYALVWNTPIPQPKKIFLAKTLQDTQALSISPDGTFLACQHGDDGVILLDVRKAAPRPLIPDQQVLAARFSPDGRFLVYYSGSGSVKLWDVSKHREVAALGHRGRGIDLSATFSADGNTFATANRAEHSIRVWKLAGTDEKLVLAGHEGGVPDVAFSPDGKVLASASKDRKVKLWDAATGKLQRTLPPFESATFESAIQSIAFSPDGRLLAAGQFGPAARPVQIWDLETLQQFVPPDDELGQSAYGVAFSPDGKILAACGNGLTLWRVSKVEQGAGNARPVSFERMIHLPGKRSLSLCISPNGKLLAWTDTNLLVCLWDLATGREIPFTCPLQAYGWRNLAFYPDSDHLTFGTIRGMVETWDTRTARWVSSCGKGAGVKASWDGQWLATSAVWSSTGSRVFSLPEAPRWSLAVSPNGERLAEGLIDGGVAIWDVPRIQAQLAQIGLAWREDARPPQQQEPPPFVATLSWQHNSQVMHYSNLGKRLAWVGRVAEAEEAYRAALKIWPDDPVPHSVFGSFLEDLGRYTEAVAEFSKAIELQPEHGSFWVQRGGAFADMGQWDKASADFFEATRRKEPVAQAWYSRWQASRNAWEEIWCKEPDAEAWYSRAMLYLRDGNQGGYREICSVMLQRFGEGAVWTCTLTPNSGVDSARIVSLAEKAIAESPKGQGYVNQDHWHVNQLGAALYRAGRFEEAIQRLTQASKLSAHPYRSNMFTTWFFLAMAHHRLGHTDEARRWLDKAMQGTEEALKSPAESLGKSGNPDGVFPPNWNRKLTLRLLRREAKQLIHGSATKPEK